LYFWCYSATLYCICLQVRYWCILRQWYWSFIYTGSISNTYKRIQVWSTKIQVEKWRKSMKKFLNKRRIINIDINKCLMKNSDFKRPSISLIKRRTERIQNKFLFQCVIHQLIFSTGSTCAYLFNIWNLLGWLKFS
jgi:hypothetical protein